MVASESSKLRIRPGNIYREDQAIIFEVDETLQKAVLPFESQDILELLLEKDQTVSELTAELRKRNNGKMSFKNLFITIRKLMAEGIVFTPDSVEQPYFDSSNIKLVNGLTVDFVVFKKKAIVAAIRPKFFYGLTFSIILSGLCGLYIIGEEGLSANFLLIKHRYDMGFVFGLVFYSTLVSCKTIIKFILSLTGYGRIYDLSIRVSPLSLALKMDDAYLYSTARRPFAVTYGFASVMSYMFMAVFAKLYILSEATAPHVMTMALLMTLFDLNPFGEGEIKKISRAFMSEEDSEHLRPFYETRVFRAALRTFNNTRKDFVCLIYSTFTITWAVGTLATLFYIFVENAPFLSNEIESPDMAQRTSAGIVLTVLLVPFVYVASDLVSTIFKNITGFSYGFSSYFKHKLGTKTIRLLDQNRLKDLIRQTPLFATVDDATLDFVVQNGLVVAYKPGTPIIQQGSKGSEIYLILSGSVHVQRREDSGLVRKLATMQSGSVFGEMSVYGVEERTADVIANERVEAFLIRADALLHLSKSADYTAQMQYVMDRIMITQYFMSQPFFAALPVELIQIFYSYGIVEEFESNKTVLEQGADGEDFYLILRGSAFAEVNGQTVNTLNQGEFFGEIALLQNKKRMATVRTAVDTTLLKVPSHIFWQLAINNLEIAAYFETVAEQRLMDTQAQIPDAA